jgi:L-amino acid N-acyltransferase YncA
MINRPSPVDVREATLADCASIAETHVASWRATYSGIIPQAHLDSLSVEARAETWAKNLGRSDTFIYVAERAGSVCGFAAAGPARNETPGYSSELYAIYVHPLAISKGIGSILFNTVRRSLRDRGHQSMYVWVLEANPFRSFYERMGGHQLTTASIEIAGVSLAEVSYGWRNL